VFYFNGNRKEEFPIGMATLSPSSPFSLVVTQDFNDGRYHEEGDTPGKREVKIENIERLYCSQSGSLLNIGGSSGRVIVLKCIDEGIVEWLALEIVEGFEDSDDEGDDEVIKQQGGGSLGLLEYLIRLAAVEEAEGMSHLLVSDDKLALYLTGVGEGGDWRESSVPTHTVNDSPFKVLKTPKKK
jgi:hypothetical protein